MNIPVIPWWAVILLALACGLLVPELILWALA